MENQNPKIQEFAETIIPDEFKKLKFFSVMFFYEKWELGIPKEVDPTPDEPFLYRGCKDFDNYSKALDCYSNTCCPASQLIEAETADDLEKLKNERIEQFKDKDWLEENIYPYL